MFTIGFSHLKNLKFFKLTFASYESSIHSLLVNFQIEVQKKEIKIAVVWKKPKTVVLSSCSGKYLLTPYLYVILQTDYTFISVTFLQKNGNILSLLF